MDKIFGILKEVIDICETNKIQYCVVGGFAVDAKKGFLSRKHRDVDICIHQNNMKRSLKIFYKNNFKITKEGLKYVFYKSNIKIDIFELFPNGEFYERRREWFNAKYPKEMFDNFQMLKLEELEFKIPSNEGLRYYGSKTTHSEDTQFTNSLPYNEDIFSKIEYKEFADYKESKKNVKIEVLTFDK